MGTLAHFTECEQSICSTRAITSAVRRPNQADTACMAAANGQPRRVKLDFAKASARQCHCPTLLLLVESLPERASRCVLRLTGQREHLLLADRSWKAKRHSIAPAARFVLNL